MEKLNLIQSLRSELTELNKQKEINIEKLKELNELYKSNDSQLIELKVELYDIKDEFFDKKAKRYLLLTASVGIVCAIIIYFACNHYLIPTGKFDYISSLFISTFCAVTISVASSYYFALNNKFDNFLIKMFPKLQIYYDRILLLNNSIDKKKEEIEKYENEQLVLNVEKHYIDGKIQKKKRELDKLTDGYFDNIQNNHVMSEIENKGKTRVRTPKNI